MDKHGPKKTHQLSVEDKDHLFHSAETIAVVGLSDKPDRDSHRVAAYLIKHGFKVIPVNPHIKSVLGLKAYPNLKEVPVDVDIVDIFRRPEEVPSIVEDAIAIGAKVVWMQEGVHNDRAARKAREAGLLVEMNKCLMKEHMNYKRNS